MAEHRPDAYASRPGSKSLSPSGFRFKLRDATNATHANLDGLFARLELRRADDYRLFLMANAMALLPLEAALAQAGIADIVSDWDRRARSDALLADLDALGARVSPEPVTINTDPAGLLGILYVLEGSRLGARVIQNRIASSRDPLVLGAQRFLSHGAEERFWPDFVALLEREIVTPADEVAAIAAARDGFDHFAQAAGRCLAAHEAA